MTYPITPNPAIHNPSPSASPSTQADAITQLRQVFFQLPELILQQVIAFVKKTTGIDIQAIADWVKQFLGSIWGGGFNLQWLTDLLGSDPFAWMENWFANVGSFLATDFTASSFNIVTAAEDFINLILGPTGLLATLVGGFLQALQIPGLDASKIVTGLFPQTRIVGLTTALADLASNADSIINNIVHALGGPSTGSIVTDIFTFLGLIPGGNIASPVNASVVPALDASKITTGTFAQSMVNITSIAAGIVSGVLTAAQVPGLDASKIISGIFGTGVIPNLDAAKIVSGIFTGSQIPALDASKITSGTFAQSMVNITSIAAGIVSGVLTAANIPGLDATKITTGIFGTGVIPNLDAAKIVSGIFTGSQIPGLDASKITSGTFGQSQVTNLVSDLLGKLGLNVFTASATAGSNVVLDPSFEDTTIVRNSTLGPGAGYSTDQSHSGTHSFKMVSQGGFDELDFLTVPGGTFAQDMAKAQQVKAGDKWLIEAWVFPKSTNTPSSGGILARFDDSKGVNSTTYVWVNPAANGGAPPDPPVGVWTKLSGYLRVPTGYDRFLPFWSTSSPTTVGNTYYIDDVMVREETASQDIIGNIIAAWTGMAAGSTNQVGVAKTAMAGANNAIAQTAAAVAQMQAIQGGATNSGKSVAINFANYANGALPGVFTVTYSGSGASTIGVNNGLAQVTEVGSVARSFIAVYNALVTDSDFQLVGCTSPSMPESNGLGTNGANYVIARSNTGGTSYVYLKVWQDGFGNIHYELGVVSSGVKTVWVSDTVAPTASTYWLAAGTSGGARIFQVMAGTQVIKTFTEVGTTSQLGASFRSCAFGGDVVADTVGNLYSPAGLAAFQFADNLPPSIVGSGAEMSRTATATVTATAGVQILTSLFDTKVSASTDITVNAPNAQFTVANAGWYKVTARVKTSGTAFPDRVSFLLYKNGVANHYIGNWHQRGLNGSSASTAPQGISAEGSIYLSAGDNVQLGYDAGVITTAGVFTGEATGFQTYFTIALESKSQN